MTKIEIEAVAANLLKLGNDAITVLAELKTNLSAADFNAICRAYARRCPQLEFAGDADGNFYPIIIEERSEYDA